MMWETAINNIDIYIIHKLKIYTICVYFKNRPLIIKEEYYWELV